jgi:hypothetical protein
MHESLRPSTADAQEAVSRDCHWHGDYWGSREAYKRMATRPHPSSQRLLSSPLFDLHPLSWTWAAASDCNGAQATWRCRSWEVYNRYHESTIRTVHFVAFPPLDPPLIRPFAHHARPCFYTQVSHIKAEGCLCLSRGVGKKTDVRSRVDLGRCTIVTGSLRYVLYTLLHSPPRPSPDPALCTPCKTLLLHAGVA